MTRATAITNAPSRNTMLIESANPTMNGRASRGSSELMNDESFSAAVEPALPPPGASPARGRWPGC